MQSKVNEYVPVRERIRLLEVEEQTLQDRLDELVEEQYLYKDNTFYYVDEARDLYRKIVKIKAKREAYVSKRNKMLAKRSNRKAAKKAKQ
jgi:hypothetical protein